MRYLNKVWSINFVDDSEILAVEKMILLANISTSLEIANWNQVQLKNLENFEVCQHLDNAMFIKLFWEIGLMGGAVL